MSREAERSEPRDHKYQQSRFSWTIKDWGPMKPLSEIIEDHKTDKGIQRRKLLGRKKDRCLFVT